jgi:cell wall-associated NlpC family hydrolase
VAPQADERRVLRFHAAILPLAAALMLVGGAPAFAQSEPAPGVAPEPPIISGPETAPKPKPKPKPKPSKRQRARAAERAARAKVVRFARAQVGKPYVYGADGPRGYDCSGLMVAAYRSIGRRLPRTTFQQLRRMRGARHAKRGDLVFGTAGHVAMYIGAGRVVHAPAPGRRVEISKAGWHLRHATRTAFR